MGRCGLYRPFGGERSETGRLGRGPGGFAAIPGKVRTAVAGNRKPGNPHRNPSGNRGVSRDVGPPAAWIDRRGKRCVPTGACTVASQLRYGNFNLGATNGTLGRPGGAVGLRICDCDDLLNYVV